LMIQLCSFPADSGITISILRADHSRIIRMILCESTVIKQRVYFIYLLISQDKKRTYTGFTDNIENRIKKHKTKGVRTTKNFGDFSYIILEKVLPDERLAREAEKYWKSASGRRRIKEILKNKKD